MSRFAVVYEDPEYDDDFNEDDFEEIVVSYDSLIRTSEDQLEADYYESAR